MTLCQRAKWHKGLDFAGKLCHYKGMEKEILLTEPELWAALDTLYTEGLTQLPYAEDGDLAERAFAIFDQIPDIDYQPAEVTYDVFRYLQDFAADCMVAGAGLLTETEREAVEAFIAE